MAVFNREQIEQGLTELGELAQKNNINIHLVVVGGAAMVLAFEARNSTRDIDVFIQSPKEAKIVRKFVSQIAEEHGWQEDWLNDGAKGYLIGISEGPLLFQSKGIQVYAPSLYQLLAMKLSAWRDDVDIADARRILQEVNQNNSKDEVWNVVEPFLVPGDELTAQYILSLIYGRHCMELIEKIAHAALERDSLQLRSLVQDFSYSNLELSKLPKPVTNNHNLLVMTAAITELLAERTNQMAPNWTKEIGALSEPFFLVESALQMKRLRTLCEKESPEPLRKRLLYAPPHFLLYA